MMFSFLKNKPLLGLGIGAGALKFSFSKTQPLFGLDIGSNSIKIAQLTETKTGLRLEKFGLKPLASELIVDGTVMDQGGVVDSLRELLAEQSMAIKDVAISVSGHSVIVKKISLPTMTESELEQSIRWEAEQYIPFDVDDVNLDFHILGEAEGAEGQNQMNVLLVAAKKDKLNEYTSLLMEVGLNAVIVDVDAFAVENMYGINYDVKPGEMTALINIGASVMNINILKEDASIFTRDISVGGNRYTEMIQKELNVGYDDAEKAKGLEAVEGVNEESIIALVNTVNAEIISEIVRSIDYFKTTTTYENIDKVVLCGGSAKINGLPGLLSERIAIPVEIADPFRKIGVDSTIFDLSYIQDVGPQASVVIGLALRKQGDR
jgi:type IV pilus assembly protein PilM